MSVSISMCVNKFVSMFVLLNVCSCFMNEGKCDHVHVCENTHLPVCDSVCVSLFMGESILLCANLILSGYLCVFMYTQLLTDMLTYTHTHMDDGWCRVSGCQTGPGCLPGHESGLAEQKIQFREHTVTLLCNPNNKWSLLLLSTYSVCMCAYICVCVCTSMRVIKVTM